MVEEVRHREEEAAASCRQNALLLPPIVVDIERRRKGVKIYWTGIFRYTRMYVRSHTSYCIIHTLSENRKYIMSCFIAIDSLLLLSHFHHPASR